MTSPSNNRRPVLLALGASALLTILIVAGSRNLEHYDAALFGYTTRNQQRLECPCHEGAFNATTGNVLYGPPPRALDRIDIEMRDGQVWATGTNPSTPDDGGGD